MIVYLHAKQISTLRKKNITDDSSPEKYLYMGTVFLLHWNINNEYRSPVIYQSVNNGGYTGVH